MLSRPSDPRTIELVRLFTVKTTSSSRRHNSPAIEINVLSLGRSRTLARLSTGQKFTTVLNIDSLRASIAVKGTGLERSYKAKRNTRVARLSYVYVFFTCVRVANGRVSVTVARDARRERTAAGGLVSRTGRARLAELSDVSLGTRAHLHPVGRQPRSAAPGRLQREVVQEADACNTIFRI